MAQNKKLAMVMLVTTLSWWQQHLKLVIDKLWLQHLLYQPVKPTFFCAFFMSRSYFCEVISSYAFWCSSILFCIASIFLWGAAFKIWFARSSFFNTFFTFSGNFFSTMFSTGTLTRFRDIGCWFVTKMAFLATPSTCIVCYAFHMWLKITL